VPFSPDSVTGGTDEVDAAADLNADVPYGTEPDLSDPIEEEVLELIHPWPPPRKPRIRRPPSAPTRDYARLKFARSRSILRLW
jgi:hypothetical protein